MNLNRIRLALIDNQRLYMLIAVGVVVLLLIGYLLVYALSISPQLQQREALLGQLRVAQAQALQKQRANTISPEDVDAAVEAAQAELEEAAQNFLAETQAANLLDRLYQYAAQTGVTVLRLESTAASTGDTALSPYYSARAFALDVQGYMADLVSFIGHITEAGKPSVQITDISIPAAEGDSDQQVLSMMITLYTSPLATEELPSQAPGLVLPSGPSGSTTGSMVELENQLAAAQNAGDWEAAIRVLASMRAVSPDDDEILLQLYQTHLSYGNELVDEGQPQKAIVQFNLALQAQPGATEAFEGLQRANQILQSTPSPEGEPTLGPSETLLPSETTEPGATSAPTEPAAPAATPTSGLVRPETWPTDWPWPPATGGQ